MSLHDKMAQRAYISGRRSEEFHNAAQKHANSTWFFVIVGGIVWYFWSWLWALIPTALALLKILQSVSSTMIETRLDKIEKMYETQIKI